MNSFDINDVASVRQFVSANMLKAVAIAGSQVLLAKKSGLTQGAISKYVRQDGLPKASTARRISKAIDGAISPYYFSPIEIPFDSGNLDFTVLN